LGWVAAISYEGASLVQNIPKFAFQHGFHPLPFSPHPQHKLWIEGNGETLCDVYKMNFTVYVQSVLK
jgi:hypothetical protein